MPDLTDAELTQLMAKADGVSSYDLVDSRKEVRSLVAEVMRLRESAGWRHIADVLHEKFPEEVAHEDMNNPEVIAEKVRELLGRLWRWDN